MMNGPKIEVSEEEYALYVKLHKLSFLTFKIMAVFAALLVKIIDKMLKECNVDK